ncbi:MAG: M48 family metalloprotease [Betaproteobacteria bacterium]|nr:M48 family metalloprotease [Betaproteobacteria bacterium]
MNPVTGRMDRGTMSLQDEIAFGTRAHEELLQEYSRLDSPALQQYVAGVGNRLAAQTHRPELTWTFTVLDSPDINAFATTGGYVYITRGLMAYLNSEAELAGVLGHEMGHITARHVARQQRDQQIGGLLQVIGVLGGAYLGGERGAELGAQIAGGGAQAAWLLPRSREHELEADRLGMDYLARSAIDPQAMTRVIDVLKLQETYSNDRARALGRPMQRMPSWLATHPSNDERLAQLRGRTTPAGASGTTNDPGRDRYLRAIDGMAYGDSRAQGVSRGAHFFHEPLGFTLKKPAAWQFQNSSERLIVVSQDQQAAVILAAVPGMNGDHNRIIREALKADSGRPERINLNGLPATYFFGTRQGEEIEATIVTFRNYDYVLSPMAQSREAQARYRNEVLAVINSFRAMNADDVRAARPFVLHTVAMPRSGSFRDLSAAPELGDAESQLRVLNQAYPSGTVAAGRLVKTIQ